MKQLEELFKQYTGRKCLSCEELPQSGSNRRYFRLKAEGISLIGAMGTSVEENKAFVSLANHFKDVGLNVPEVYTVSSDKVYYLQEDLGTVSLFDAIASGRQKGSYSAKEVALLKKTMALLPKFQFEGGRDMDYSVCFPQPEFDERNIWFDFNYFKYCFLKTSGLEFSEIKLHQDMEKMCSDLLGVMRGSTFMYRDFQARNVMLKDGKPYFIDFQGGRKGPFYYDIASFVWQARANYSDELKEILIGVYKKELKKYVMVSEKEFNHDLRLFVLFRTLQVLGAYGFRGYFEKKPHFLQSIPFAIENLRKLIKKPFVEYPYLQQVLTELTKMRQLKDLRRDVTLEVHIFSFAYKKGIPMDDSGNGGGYVFDCRGLENPGKFERYKTFTGLDEPVIKFLEDEGGIKKYLANVYDIVDPHVKRFVERKFTHLQVCFGCTGGQHRSVYCARHLADHIAKKFNVKVKLTHRELDIEEEV
ncbi:MAG: phosphotransferase [Bacteroidales bacterium]|jgi:aminoglycoside/choline kinase family phosphotransferase|nr:phosphotransferase [Bacteroidales bacterium]MBP5517513.1 phosphotransferase [Bacteroidales bacterium]MBR6972892.1 phosphotransferase [Bacteroidales bacterium]